MKIGDTAQILFVANSDYKIKMPSFHISSNINWQELDNAINTATKILTSRYDFKGVKAEITLDRKANTITLLCGSETKLEALVEVFHNSAVKRGISLLSFEFKDPEKASGMSVRQLVNIQAGIAKEKAKEIIAVLKDSKLKVQAQIENEQVRVSSKSRDDLQECIALLKSQQNKLQVPMEFGNFRD